MINHDDWKILLHATNAGYLLDLVMKYFCLQVRASVVGRAAEKVRECSGLTLDIWPGEFPGCTTDLYECNHVYVEYRPLSEDREIISTNTSSHLPPPTSSSNQVAVLFVNIRACGYPPTTVCQNWWELMYYWYCIETLYCCGIVLQILFLTCYSPIQTHMLNVEGGLYLRFRLQCLPNEEVCLHKKHKIRNINITGYLV